MIADSLEPDDSPEATAEARLDDLSDNEYFQALEVMDRDDTLHLRDADGDIFDHREGIRDERDRS